MAIKKDLSILIGNVLDHFDAALYGFLVPILAPVFFPQQDSVVSLMLGYSVLAISFFAGPIGSIIFGNIAKSFGPNISLSYSLIGISFATALIGFLPTYNQVGIIAPIFLIILRVMGTIFSAGETTIAKLYILEGKSAELAFKASYYYQLSTMLGIILASFIATIIYFLPANDIYWRLCFFLGGITGIIGIIVRCQDNLISKISLDKQNLSTLKSIWQYRKIMTAIAFTSIFSYATYSIPFILMNSFVPIITNISIKTMMGLNTILLMLDILLIPIIGRIMSKCNSAKILLNSCLLFAITIIPLIYYLEGSRLWYVIFVRVWIIILGVIFACPLNIWYKNLVIKDNKYLIVGLANSIGSGALGKATPAISLAIWHFTDSLLGIGLYLAVIGLATAYMVKSQ